MAVVVGTSVPRTGTLFYVDGASNKSVSGSGTIQSLSTREEVTSGVSSSGGYLTGDYSNVSAFAPTSLSAYTALTACASLQNMESYSGVVFSIAGPYAPTQAAAGLAAPDPHSVFTTTATAAAYVDGSIGSTQMSADPHVSFTTIATATSYVDVAVGSTQMTSEPHTIFTVQATASSYVDVAVGSTQMTSEPHLAFTTQAGQHAAASLIDPGFELSLGFKQHMLTVRHRVGNTHTNVSCKVTPTPNDIYAVIYRAPTGSVSPISVYQNGELVLETGVLSTVSSFEAGSVQLLSRGGIDDVAAYRVRSVLIYNRELNASEILQLNSLTRSQ